MNHKRVAKPVKRARRKVVRFLYPHCHAVSRVCRIYPDRAAYPHAVVEVRLCRDRLRMAQAVRQQGHTTGHDLALESAGMVIGSWRRATKTDSLRAGRMVARMFLSARSVRNWPTEIISHECGHAAMCWARWRRANLDEMPGEEVMCYALGRLVAQLNHYMIAWGVYE